MASSPSSATPQLKYDVFLSFRGVDTLHNFTSHLYESLLRQKIDTFIADQLVTGDDISSSLMNAIKASRISVIVFSRNYASSQWCLRELEQIIECKRTSRHIVIPVFYHVDPTHVRNQTGTFGDAFAELRERFREQSQVLDRWKAALREAANLYGFHVNGRRSEGKLINNIVHHILAQLESKFRDVGYEKALELIFTAINFALEVPSAAFDQLSSASVPQYALYAMLISWIAKVFSIVELFWKARTKGKGLLEARQVLVLSSIRT